jgi:hypothetical protein
MTIKILILMIFTFILAGCPNNYDFQYDTIITETPVNLDKLNSIYDDFNSDIPYPAGRLEIFYSTNKGSDGEHFDIVCRPINVSYHEKDDILDFNFDQADFTPFKEKELLSCINTRYDELGPYSYYHSNGWQYHFFANNENGDFNLKTVYTNKNDWGTYNAQHRIYGPIMSNITNSTSDELYPTIDNNSSKLIFCSNREPQSFNIYEASLDLENNLFDYLLIQDSIPVTQNTILSSDADDKCPSITNNLLVYTSNREGGCGGYDLYYSIKTNNEWSAPINFGSTINSEYDEYRPITFRVLDLFDLMVFSSNRPNGKGMFDLYCVKIGDLVK